MARPIKRPDHHYKPFEFSIDIEDAFDYLDKFKNSPDYPKSFSYYTPNKYKILGDILENKFGINMVEARKIVGMWFDKNREKRIVKLTESDLTRIVRRVINESSKKEIDVKGKKCELCGKGTYKETSQMDDLNGTLHCSKCDKMVDRYKKYTPIKNKKK